MKNVKRFLFALLIFIFIVLPTLVSADSPEYSTVGVGGYDPVAYFKEGKAMKGNGWHVVYHKGATYVFVNKKNKKKFETDPDKYLPAYGGYCAYGVAVGKKFVADPEVWKIFKGILYLNLDKDIQSKWAKDIPGYLKKPMPIGRKSGEKTRLISDEKIERRVTQFAAGLFYLGKHPFGKHWRKKVRVRNITKRK